MSDLFEEAAQYLKTPRDLIRFGVTQFEQNDLFYGHGYDNAWDEAVALVLNRLFVGYDQAQHMMDARLLPSEVDGILADFKRRVVDKTPVAYITGRAWFAGLPYTVDERVLVPRSPIAELIEHEFAPYVQRPLNRVLDLCSGSGCIGIAIAHQFNEAQVDLAELSLDAIAVAIENLEMHQVGDRVNVLHSDLFAGVSGRYDLIVSNPPYVNAYDIETMPDEYHQEPEMGLGSGDDGLYLTRRILAEASNYLTENGWLIVEVGNSWVSLQEQFPEVNFSWIEFEQGGLGVFAISAHELQMHQSLFIAANTP